MTNRQKATGYSEFRNILFASSGELMWGNVKWCILVTITPAFDIQQDEQS